MNIFTEIITSPIISTILTLLIIFQWFRQQAKEQSVKHNLFAMRRTLIRFQEVSDSVVVSQKATDLSDWLDATLATLGARFPFVRRLDEVMDMIKSRFSSESEDDLKHLPNEIGLSKKA